MFSPALNIFDYDRDPVQAIQEAWMDFADADVDVTAEGIAEMVVDAHCARGDYDGCSPELEQDYEDALAHARRAL